MPRSEEDNEQIRAQRRSEILAAATRVFVDKGLARAKVTDIAAAANLSNGLLYHYFPSKEAVFEAIALEMIARAEEELTSDRHRAVERLAYVLRRRLDQLENKVVDASKVIMQAALQGEIISPSSRQVVCEHLRRLTGRVTDLITEAQRDGDIDDGVTPDELTLMMMFLFRGMSVTVPDFALPVPRIDTMLKFMRLTPAGIRRSMRALHVERKKAAV